MNESSDNILRKDFIRQCEDLTADIIDLSIDLNNGKLNIIEDVNRLIVVINGMKIYKEKEIISKYKKNVKEKYDEARCSHRDARQDRHDSFPNLGQGTLRPL